MSCEHPRWTEEGDGHGHNYWECVSCGKTQYIAPWVLNALENGRGSSSVESTHEERIAAYRGAVGNLARIMRKNDAHIESLDRWARRQEEDEMDQLMPHKYGTGTYVWKPKGYPFEGTVVSAFTTLGGDIRYVVESKLSPGMLHIFNEAQLEAV